jgi:putative beta-barrel porin BBP2
MQKKKNGAVAAAILSLCGATVARAELDYEVEAGAGYSDNILREPTDEQDESLADIGLTLDWEQSTRRLEGDARVDLSYVEYLSGDLDSEVLGYADANVILNLVPERFLWSFQDSFGQARNDPFQPISPENRESINTFSTGPEVRFRFGSLMQARLHGFYSAVSYEDSPLDAQRAGGGVSFERVLSEGNFIGLNFVADHSDLEDPDATDFSRQSASLSYSLESGRTTLAVQAGYTKLIFNDAPNDDGPLFDLTLTRELTRSTTLTLTASDSFTDAGEMLQGSIDQPATPPGSIIAQGDPFESRDIGLDWRFARGRTSFGFGAQLNESIYENNSSFDSKRSSFMANFSRQLQTNLTLELNAQIFDEQYETSDSDAQEWMAGAALSWRFGRHIGSRLRFDHFDRSSSSGLGEYTESRVLLSITYAGGR